MFRFTPAPLANCLQFGTTAIVASALTFGVTCNIPKAPAKQSILAAPTRSVVAARAVSTPVSPIPEVLPIPDAMPFISQPPVDCALVACVALTFDDGPDPRTTPQLLETLAAQQARATFFMLGQSVQKYPELTRRIHTAGHELGNHTWNHANLTKTPPHQIVHEIMRTQEAFQAAGVEAPRLFRPPYGALDETVRPHVQLHTILWNVDPKDWAEPDPAKIAAHIDTQVKPGAIILLHDVKPATVAAAPQYIQQLKQKYQLVTVSQLLRLTPETPKGEFTHR